MSNIGLFTFWFSIFHFPFSSLLQIQLESGHSAMNKVWTRYRRFRTIKVVGDFNREALAIEIDLNIPAQRVVRVLNRIVASC